MTEKGYSKDEVKVRWKAGEVKVNGAVVGRMGDQNLELPGVGREVEKEWAKHFETWEGKRQK